MYPGPKCIVGPLEPTPAGSPVREILGSSPPGPTAAGAPWSALICISLSIEGPEGWARWGELGCSLNGGGQDRDETMSLTFVPCGGCTGSGGMGPDNGLTKSCRYCRRWSGASCGQVDSIHLWLDRFNCPTAGGLRKVCRGARGGPVVNESPA